MVNLEKIHGRSRKKILSRSKVKSLVDPEYFLGQSEKNSMVDPEKIHCRSRRYCMVEPEKNPWQIQKKLHHRSRSSLELCNPQLCHTFLLLYLGKQNGLQDLTPAMSSSHTHTICLRPSYMKVLQ